MGDWSRAANDIYKVVCVGASTCLGTWAHSWGVNKQGGGVVGDVEERWKGT